MGVRAERTAETRRRVLRAAFELWRERSFEDITLRDLAERAGVTVQTVLRHFGSKEGVVEAAIEEDVGSVRSLRDTVGVGEVDQAVDVLLEHYERDGPAAIRNLEIEDRIEAARKVAEVGRMAHRAWCERVFGPFLPDDQGRSERLDAFVAATDLYLWKLLRMDLGRSRIETRAAIRELILGLVELSREERRR